MKWHLRELRPDGEVAGVIDLVGNRSKRFKVISIAALLALVVFAVTFALGGYNESEHLLQKPGGMIVFAFVGCWILIILAKLIMTPLLQRDEDYYEKGCDDSDV